VGNSCPGWFTGSIPEAGSGVVEMRTALLSGCSFLFARLRAGVWEFMIDFGIRFFDSCRNEGIEKAMCEELAARATSNGQRN
jgi:hypothetical protein